MQKFITIWVAVFCLFSLSPLWVWAEEAADTSEKKIEINTEKIKKGAEKAADKTGKGLKKAADKTEKGLTKAVEKTGKALEKTGKKIKEHVVIEKDEGNSAGKK